MRITLLILMAGLCFACNDINQNSTTFPEQYVGAWQLISSDYHSKDSVTSNMVDGQEMIKIITPTHFAFFLHDLQQGKDSSTVAYMSGGGTVSFSNGEYVENLDFCTARTWEGHSFKFKLELKGDTLIQQGVEELEELGLGDENLLLIEKYVRVKE
ncbi:hypothetical protein KEM09_05235 [Carboxylicivirga mesophila]|uniref:Lipocalin-like domain-containing protein n=1 Tax=Carboxylicivirga mesophila TaxID=1166478 RepID=A0ABS5K754_9BACT|nr:hypothetical protein [Carboxylicivirga mesophila]MBS2210790.1 hypothetical protein [Carboxylicivirga mesophila]